MLDQAKNPQHKATGGSQKRALLFPLKTHQLIYEAGGVRLIDRLNFSLTGDTITMIMGPNGAGKSLLLRLLHGIILPTKGYITWGGRLLDERIREAQAMVFQRPVLLRRSVQENIDFVLRLRGKETGDRHIKILEDARLSDHAGQPARLLSIGEQQRLALARALALEPQVLFLDEPTANLDPASTALIEAQVLSAYRGGTKIIFVTHDPGQAKRLGDDILFLHRGQVQEFTPKEQFFKTPQSETAQSYLAGEIII